MVAQQICEGSSYPSNGVFGPAAASRGLRNYYTGRAAEELVARRYEKAGARLIAKRWRGTSGEIDLIFRSNDLLEQDCWIFVEVKSSATLDAAAGLISRRQTLRLFQAADEFLASRGLGGDVYMRFDLALTDRMARCEVLQNAFML